MQFSCPTLHVVLYQVLQVSNYRDNCVKKVPVILVVLHATPLQNILCVFINLCCADSVCLCSTDFAKTCPVLTSPTENPKSETKKLVFQSDLEDLPYL